MFLNHQIKVFQYNLNLLTANYSEIKSWFQNDNVDNFKWKMEDIMKLVESFEEFGLLIKGTSDTIESEPSGVFFGILLGIIRYVRKSVNRQRSRNKSKAGSNKSWGRNN